MITILALIFALVIIWVGTSVFGNLSSMSTHSPIDPHIIKDLQPRQPAYQIKPKSQHDINIEKSTAYHLDNNNPWPGLDDMSAFLAGAELADWQTKRARLGESDYQGSVGWDGSS